MIASLAVTAGLLLQAAGNGHPARASRAPDPVRIWRADSTAYVMLLEPGNLLVLHVDAIGRIQVLFPAGPDDDSRMLANDTLVAIPLPPAAEGNPATFVAVRSRWAFEFAALRAGSAWNYNGALLLQPTAGDPLGALLDIADRVTDGRPYDYGAVEYLRGGTMVAGRQPLAPTVCLSCVRQGTAVAAAPSALPTNAVDCSNASLTNSFCGVNSGSVSITNAPQVVYQAAPPAAPAPAVYVPYFVPMSFRSDHRRFDRPMLPAPPPAPRPSFGAAYPIEPRLVVPSSSQLGTFTGRRH
jgi:hypothetical protein